MKTILLEDYRTKVPVSPHAYKNKVKFEASLLQIIDTNAVYQEISERYDGWYGLYKFYPNGCMNYFSFKGSHIPTTNFFNPSLNGYRGVYYMKGSKIKGDLYAEINGWGHIGLLVKEFKFSGDTLFVLSEIKRISPRIYIKRKLPPEYFTFKAAW